MALTREELIAMGYDEETAALLSMNSGQTCGGGAPFKKFSMNYSDIITDEAGVKKGNFIVGFVEDKKTLTLKEVGTDFGAEAEFFIVGSVYQYSKFDTATNSNVFMTPLFRDLRTAKTQRDKKTGQTVEDYKAAGMRPTFNHIMLIALKTKDGYETFLHYLHGTNLNKWLEQTDKLGLKNLSVDTLVKVKSVKVATDYQPAWCFEIITTTERDAKDMKASMPVVAESIKKFNTWVDESNAGGSNPTSGAPKSSSPESSDGVSEDDDIQF